MAGSWRSLFIGFFLIGGAAGRAHAQTTTSAAQVYEQTQMMAAQARANLNLQAQQQAQSNNLLAASIGQMCPLMMNSLFGAAGTAQSNVNNSQAIMTLTDQVNTEAGFQYDPQFPRQTVVKAAASPGHFEANCDNFMDKQGRIGPWGRTVLAEMENYPQIYTQKVPADMASLCPAYPRLDANERRLVWVWVFKSIAGPESSCNPRDISSGISAADTNYGLLQLDPAHCGGGSLLDPSVNLRCGVKVLANELSKRNSLTINFSDRPGGTYWGTLRNDDHNLRRGADIRAGQQTRALIRQFSLCGG